MIFEARFQQNSYLVSAFETAGLKNPELIKMGKKLIIGLVVIGALAILAAVYAQSQAQEKEKRFSMIEMGMNGMIQYHDKMYKVMEEGTYADLQKLRDELGFSIMPWVQNEEDFKLAKQMHERMDKWHEENEITGSENVMGKSMGCPMMG